MMSEEKQHKSSEKTDKPKVRDLPTHNDVKGGSLKPASPDTGGKTIQPVPAPPGQGS